MDDDDDLRSAMFSTIMQVVHFRSLEEPEEDDFCLELSKLCTYDAVAEEVAQCLGLDDPSKLRFTCHNCYTKQPAAQPIDYQGVDYLINMLFHRNQTTDILYYEVLDIPLPELQLLKTLRIAFQDATQDEVVIYTITLPKNSTVGDLLNDLKTKVDLSDSSVELRLLKVFDSKIYKIYQPNEKIEYIHDQRWTIQAEEVPEEERYLGPNDFLIHVYHFYRDIFEKEILIQTFGEPFLLLIHTCETLADIKVKIANKLNLPYQELAKWKFAFVSPGQLVYLHNTDFVSNYFPKRDVLSPWVYYLGLEHYDNIPQRWYLANEKSLADLQTKMLSPTSIYSNSAESTDLCDLGEIFSTKCN